MNFLREYGVATVSATHFYIPMIKRGVIDFAVGADWTPAAGDVKISKDGGAAANITNLPTALTMGNGAIWLFQLTATEMQAKQIVVTVIDAATKAVEDQEFIVETFGNASALYPFNFGLATQPVNVTQFGGTNGTFNAGRAEVNATHLAGTSQTAGADLGTRVDTTVSSRATPAQVNAEVLDVLNVDTWAELAAVPTVPATITQMLRWVFMLSRNKITQTDALTTLRNDADSVTVATSATSDNGVTATRGEYT